MSFVDRVSVRTAHSDSRRTKWDWVEPLLLPMCSGVAVDPEENILLQFANAVRLYMHRSGLHAVALGRKDEGMGRMVVSLNKLKHYFSGSKSGTSF